MRPSEGDGKIFMIVFHPDFAVSERNGAGITIVFETSKPIEAIPHALYSGTAIDLTRTEAERLWTRLGNRLGKTA